MSACFAREDGEWFGVDGLVVEGEAGGAEVAVALCVDFSHQHVVQAWTRDRAGRKYVKYQVMSAHIDGAVWFLEMVKILYGNMWYCTNVIFIY